MKLLSFLSKNSKFAFPVLVVLFAILFFQQCNSVKSLQTIVDDQTSEIDACLEQSLNDDTNLKRLSGENINLKSEVEYMLAQSKKQRPCPTTSFLRDTVYLSKLVAMECPGTEEEYKEIFAVYENQLNDMASALGSKESQVSQLVEKINSLEMENARLSTIETVNKEIDFLEYGVKLKTRYSLRGEFLSPPNYDLSYLITPTEETQKEPRNYFGLGFQTILNNESSTTEFLNLSKVSYARKWKRFLLQGDLGSDKDFKNISGEGKILFNF